MTKKHSCLNHCSVLVRVIDVKSMQREVVVGTCSSSKSEHMLLRKENEHIQCIPRLIHRKCHHGRSVVEGHVASSGRRVGETPGRGAGQSRSSEHAEPS